MPVGIELLAPARNWTTGKVAIDCGADAVYIAAESFGAREAAGNTMGDIEQLVRYAHRFYAKVYLTLNTILFDQELEAARELAVEAWHSGCDALIVQDMALLEMDLPPIPLIASTQAHNTTPEKVKFLQEVGFQRVILARELPIQQIQAIREQTTVELEAFVHGSLCVSYSGQCYLSQALTERSANRGICAQPCRSTYDLLEANGKIILREKHLLSLRDVQRAHALQDMLKAGITSFKIEGRLKNESYVKNVTSFYRQKLDTLLDGQSYKKISSGKSIYSFTPQPEKTFSRGFIDYFIDGERRLMASFNTAKAMGEEVGRVTGLDSDQITYEKKLPLHNADGLCFFNDKEELRGTNVNKVEENKVWLNTMRGLQKGAMLYRNYDHKFEKQLQRPVTRKIAVEVRFEEQDNEIVLSVKDEDGVEVSLRENNNFKKAENVTKNLENIKASLEKTGGTPFEFQLIPSADNVTSFFPSSQLNEWRRKLVEDLINAREVLRERTKMKIIPNELPFLTSSLDYRANVSNALAEKFYQRHSVIYCEKAYELMPRDYVELMRTKYCLLYEIGYCPKQNSKVKLQEPLFLMNNGLQLRLSFNCMLCEMVIN
ncbi:MAG: U32 family peptidase [Prevotellaceae bacterium]|nr:U32 family peptidase [Prevotellaceae bacterium]